MIFPKNFAGLPLESAKVLKEAHSEDEKGHAAPYFDTTPHFDAPNGPESLLLAAVIAENPARAALLIDSMSPHLTEAEKFRLNAAKQTGAELARCGPTGRLRVLSRCMKPAKSGFDRSVENFERMQRLISAMRAGNMAALLPSLMQNASAAQGMGMPAGGNGMAALLPSLMQNASAAQGMGMPAGGNGMAALLGSLMGKGRL